MMETFIYLFVVIFTIDPPVITRGNGKSVGYGSFTGKTNYT